ncbi:histidinol phosphate aminotransferase [Rufibacter radiotolerans]|uniref:Histidinol-phosphate aminotransferase n=1 Tax=Rufibacter radiotolerans TaxID=1379910 RepID=A0A0H4VPD5_9BACT|nr:histidinol-phosphate transaminase [Rufibacter radiotolerans]AKQ45574.1 histidinol phosphate aminotransferase [Rufibacter radiotolerans]
MFSIDKFIRPHLLSLKPYSSARDEFEGEASVYLDANENNLGSLAGGVDYNRYPDPYQKAIKEKLSLLKGIRPEQIFIGNGSDEAIDLLVRLVCEPGKDEVILLPPTYGMYEVSANIHHVGIQRVALDERFQPVFEKIAAKQTDRTKILFLCSPNNPTGNLLNPDTVERLIKSFNGLVVVDEAYIDFTEAPSWSTRLFEFPNLVVLQTLSKAWGMAGLRLGMAFASPEIIAYLNKIKPPYNINAVTQELVSAALDKTAQLQDMLQVITTERERVMAAFNQMPLIEKVFPSDANFVLVQVANANDLYAYLLERGVVVRNRSTQPGCANCLRITIGTPAENDHLLGSLKAYSQEKSVA